MSPFESQTSIRKALVAQIPKPTGKPDAGLLARRAHHDLIRENANRVIRRQVRDNNKKLAVSAKAKSTTKKKAK